MKLSEIKIRNIYSVRNDLIVVYNHKGKRRKSRIKNFQWYFVVSEYDYNHNYIFKELQDLELIEHADINGEWIKIYCDKNGGRKNSNANTVIQMLKEKDIKVYEADLHSAKRFMVDNDIQVSEEYDILYFDIETDDTTRKIHIGKERILSIAAVDNKGNEFYFDDEDESLLLQKFLKLLRNYDVLAGWNIYGFDLPYIKGMDERTVDGKYIHTEGRMEKYGLRFEWNEIACIDMMKRAMKVFQEDASLKSFSLENISQHFLKKGKIKFEGRVIDLYNNDRKTFKSYNLTDCKLLRELDDKIGMIGLIAKECALSKTLMIHFGGLYVSEVLDNMILREAHKEGIYCPSKRYGEKHTDYVGGMVFEPKKGFFENVYVFDFKSLYPSIILTSNIGFDTITNEEDDNYIINPGSNVYFIKNKQSIIAKVVGRLVEERQIYKQKRLDLVAQGKMKSAEYEMARANEIIIKELSNSVYGIMGLQSMRYYSLETAESITKMGHFLLQFTRDFFNGNGYNVIYGDTDSVFVESKNKMSVDDVLLLYHEELEEKLKDYNIDKSWIYLKYEKLFDAMIMVGKKYYTGRVSNIEGKEVNEFIVKGLDLVKKGTIPIALESQQSIIDLILVKGSEKDINERISYYREKMLNGKFKFDDLKILTRLGREVGDYKQQNAPHVRIAKELIERDGHLDSNDVEYVVVDDSSSDKQIVHRGTFNGEFDRTYYWNNKVFPGIARVLEVVYPNTNWNDKFKIKVLKGKNKISKNQLTLF